MRRVARTAIAALGLLTGVARAARPTLAGEATFGQPGGQILVHYATTGVDAPLPADSDGDGVPDFVVQVATTAETALQHFIALGFERPRSDATLGGDGRIDIYLRNLNSADGNAGIDRCDGDRCAGFIQAENDFAGYSYDTLTEGIRSVVPHELFHLVQDGYSSSQIATWTEGTAVWSVENLYGDGNSDFERFLPAFLPKMYRAFERTPASFDGYPYGAALWPYFLEQRFGVGVVVAAWQACATAEFLDAIDVALAPEGSSSDQAFVEMSRWNWFTGSRADLGMYPGAASWPEVQREPGLALGTSADAASAQVYLDGLAARYVPITLGAQAQILVEPGTLDVEAWIVPDGHGIADGVALDKSEALLITTHAAGGYTLVLTGLSRNIVTTPVTVSLRYPAPDGPDPDDGGGCRATRSPNGSLIAIALALMVTARLTRRPRRA